MDYTVLINDSVKRALLNYSTDQRNQARKAFEFLESGLWEGGLRVKKLRGFAHKTILEARLNRDDRILFTLGRPLSTSQKLLIYVWSIVSHDAINRSAKILNPAEAPFLNFEPVHESTFQDVELDSLGETTITQEPIEARVEAEAGVQRWFVLDDHEWKRLLLYSRDHFELHLYLSQEQSQLLGMAPPLLISGTAGSGKTTLCVYYLLRSDLRNRSRVLVTYNRYLKDFCSRIAEGLMNRDPSGKELAPPQFYNV